MVSSQFEDFEDIQQSKNEPLELVPKSNDTKWIDGYISLFNEHILHSKKYSLFLKSSPESTKITDKHYLPWDFLSNLRNGNIYALQSLPNSEQIVKDLFAYLDKFRQFGASHFHSQLTQVEQDKIPRNESDTLSKLESTVTKDDNKAQKSRWDVKSNKGKNRKSKWDIPTKERETKQVVFAVCFYYTVVTLPIS